MKSLFFSRFVAPFSSIIGPRPVAALLSGVALCGLLALNASPAHAWHWEVIWETAGETESGEQRATWPDLQGFTYHQWHVRNYVYTPANGSGLTLHAKGTLKPFLLWTKDPYDTKTIAPPKAILVRRDFSIKALGGTVGGVPPYLQVTPPADIPVRISDISNNALVSNVWLSGDKFEVILNLEGAAKVPIPSNYRQTKNFLPPDSFRLFHDISFVDSISPPAIRVNPDPDKFALLRCPEPDPTEVNQYIFLGNRINELPVGIYTGSATAENLKGRASWKWGRRGAVNPLEVSSETTVTDEGPCCDNDALYQNRPVFSHLPHSVATRNVGSPDIASDTLVHPLTANPDLNGSPFRGLGFDGLPADNDEFGPYEVKHFVTDDNNTKVQVGRSCVALFYKATDTDHPHGGPKGYYYGSMGTWAEVDTPNWFYYYDQAWKNPWLINIRYSANSQSQYNNGDQFIWVGNEAHGYRDYTNLFGRVRAANGILGPLQEVGEEATRGIDTYARVVSHECTHLRCYNHIHDDNAPDADNDEVPDDWEGLVGLVVGVKDSLGWVTAHQSEYEYDVDQGDDEVFARMHERGVFGPMDLDWAAGDSSRIDLDSGLNYALQSPNYCQRLARYPAGLLTLNDLDNNVDYAPQP